MTTQNKQKLPSRLSFVQEAPTFAPSEDDWRDPLKYIASIREEAERFGICRILPPENNDEFKRNPQLTIDASQFRFQTRIQTVNELNVFSLRVHDQNDDYLATKEKEFRLRFI